MSGQNIKLEFEPSKLITAPERYFISFSIIDPTKLPISLGSPNLFIGKLSAYSPTSLTNSFVLSVLIGPGAILIIVIMIKNNLLILTVNADYYDSRDLNPYFVGGAELKVGNLLYLRSGIRREYQHYSDSIDDLTINEMDDSANSELYVSRWSWGFGLTSESFPAIPYKLNLDYSVSDLGVLGISSQIGLTFKL